jgi:hypothetical protein
MCHSKLRRRIEFGSERMTNCCSLRIEDSPRLAAERFKLVGAMKSLVT